MPLAWAGVANDLVKENAVAVIGPVGSQQVVLTQKIFAESTGPADAFHILAAVAKPDAVDGLSYHCYGLDSNGALRVETANGIELVHASESVAVIEG